MLEDQIIKFLQPILDKYRLSWKRIITMPSISDDFKTISMLLKGDNLDVVIDMDIKIKNNRWYIESTKVTIGIPEQKFGNQIIIEKTKNKDDVLRTLSLAIFKTRNLESI